MRKSWLFQANPKTFDIDGYLQTRPAELLWTVNQLADQVEVGDQVFIWRAGGNDANASGVIAECEVMSSVELLPEDESAVPFWKTSDDPSLPRERTRLRLVRVADPSSVIKRSWAKDDPILREMRIIRLASETNFLLRPAEAQRLNALWINTGQDWSYPQLVAALWVYAQGKVDAERTAALVSDVAIRIGRTIGSVESKRMNFRALDPSDDRAGFPAVSNMDKVVWKQFYDRTRRALNMVSIDQEYQRHWEEQGQRIPPVPGDFWSFLPSAEEFVAHWQEHEADERTKDLLVTNYWASDHTITPKQLSDQLGLANVSLVNIRYGASAGIVASAMGVQYPAGADNVSLFVEIIGPTGGKMWRLHEQVASAIETLGWLGQPPTHVSQDQVVESLLQYEGKKMQRRVTVRSRSGSVRDLCLEVHKAICAACGLDFGKRFGDEFVGLIDVHHLNPLAFADEDRLTDPVEDCRPLCPNCHRMAHYGLPPKQCRTIDDLKQFVGSSDRAAQAQISRTVRR